MCRESRRLAASAKGGHTMKTATRPCPSCQEDIPEEATKCRHCGSFVYGDKPKHEGTCPFCRSDIKPEAVLCRFCHSYVGSGGPPPMQAASGSMQAALTRGSRLVDVTPPFQIPPEGLPDGVPLAIGCAPCGYAAGDRFGVLARGGIGERQCLYVICEKVGNSNRCRVETRVEACDIWKEVVFG